MIQKNRNKIITLFLGAIIVLVVFAMSHGTKNDNSFNPSGLQKQFSNSIDTMGPSKAFASLKASYSNSSFSEQHSAAHIFGEVLYDKEGSQGISVCDSSFGYGCYHGFFIEAVDKNGPEVVFELDKACVAKYGVLGLGCPHGIGHGLLEFFGHDINGLNKSLAACSKLSWKGEVFGCSDGVFMEYNSPTIFGSISTSRTRTLDNNNPSSPCNQISQYQSSCYFNLGSYLLSAYSKPSPIQSLCEKVTNAKNEKYCFMGYGYGLAQDNNFNIEDTKNNCDKFSDSEDAYCRAGASWIFFAVPSKRELSDSLCSGLSNDGINNCIAESNILGLKGK